MSKIWNSLKMAERKKERQGSEILPKNSKTPWLKTALISVVILSLLALNLHFFLTMKTHSSEIDNMFSELDKLHGALKRDREKILESGKGINQMSYKLAAINTDMAGINIKIDDANHNISKLEKFNGTNNETVEGLSKAQKALFKKLGLLDIKLKQIQRHKEEVRLK